MLSVSLSDFPRWILTAVSILYCQTVFANALAISFDTLWLHYYLLLQILVQYLFPLRLIHLGKRRI